MEGDKALTGRSFVLVTALAKFCTRSVQTLPIRVMTSSY